MNQSRIRRRRHDHLYHQIRQRSIYADDRLRRLCRSAAAVIAIGHSAPCTQNRIICVRSPQ
jgi:hypothetical protein